jgi:hypothetical protein
MNVSIRDIYRPFVWKIHVTSKCKNWNVHVAVSTCDNIPTCYECVWLQLNHVPLVTNYFQFIASLFSALSSCVKFKIIAFLYRALRASCFYIHNILNYVFCYIIIYTSAILYYIIVYYTILFHVSYHLSHHIFYIYVMSYLILWVV